MEARLIRTLALCALALCSLGANYRTQNFMVSAATPALAREVGDMAEKYRNDLAMEWLGKPLAAWQEPCPIRVTVGDMGAGGVTQFSFEPGTGRPTGWIMEIRGTRERVLDSVLPHEVTHTIFATHFGGPLPRWADEGACTTVEHISERSKQEKNLIAFLTSNRGIAFNQMFAMTQYPKDILPLYSQGYSLARFLIAQGGKQKFVNYVGDGMRMKNWTAATRQHYGFESLSELQQMWVEWVRRGSSDDSAAEFVAMIRQQRSPAKQSPIHLASNTTPKSSAPAAQSQAVELAADASRPHEGWYARKRDESRQTGTLVARPNSPSQAPLGARPLDISHDPLPEAIQVSRPQPLTQATPTVIEWSRPPQRSTLPQGQVILR